MSRFARSKDPNIGPVSDDEGLAALVRARQNQGVPGSLEIPPAGHLDHLVVDEPVERVEDPNDVSLRVSEFSCRGAPTMRMNWMLRATLLLKVGGCRADVTTRRCAAWIDLRVDPGGTGSTLRSSSFLEAGRVEFLVDRKPRGTSCFRPLTRCGSSEIPKLTSLRQIPRRNSTRFRAKKPKSSGQFSQRSTPARPPLGCSRLRRTFSRSSRQRPLMKTRAFSMKSLNPARRTSYTKEQ